MRLIHISDPHLTDLTGIARQRIQGKRRLGHLSWRRRRRHRHRREHLDALCAAVGSLAPNLIVVTGDLVHIGAAEELVAAAQWLDELHPSAEVLVTPGNHDLYGPDSWAVCESLWQAHLHLPPAPGHVQEAGEPPWWARFPSHRHVDGVEVYGLNSGMPTGIGLATGALGAGQRGRLAHLLASAPAAALKVLALHHPPVPGMVGRYKALRDAPALQPLLKATHIVLHGHGHWNRSYRSGAARIFATGSASTEDAPFRVLDIERLDAAFGVCMRLHVKQGGGFKAVESMEFTVSTR